MPAVSYTLLINGSPAGARLVDAIQQIEVEDHAGMADMMRLSVAVGVRENGSGWNVLDDGLFGRLTSIGVTVNVGSGSAEPLIDAHVIEANVEFSNEPGRSVLRVVAMDPTVLMNLEEKVRPWPDMADSDIASTIFGEHGFTADVEQTQPSRQEVDHTTIQRGTDIQFLRQLAERNGYECYAETRGGQPLAHFHKPRLEQSAQGVLSVNMGQATNVNRFKARYDMLRPTTAHVTGLDVETRSDQPAQVDSPSQRGLGNAPALGGDHPRRVLLSQTGLSRTDELQTYAQAVADGSTWAITAEGELNTVSYGGVLRAKRPVEVRGAGRQFSGTYYAERVLHTLRGDGYTQRFSLRRNALGLTGQERFVEDMALTS
ncbi:MAG: phage late control D family protein [Rubrobacteraceae bacterium]|nr:phage late control D family protein [Rubrobacteraceae bacterium]